jgi:hypothetical protein
VWSEVRHDRWTPTQKLHTTQVTWTAIRKQTCLWSHLSSLYGTPRHFFEDVTPTLQIRIAFKCAICCFQPTTAPTAWHLLQQYTIVAKRPSRAWSSDIPLVHYYRFLVYWEMLNQSNADKHYAKVFVFHLRSASLYISSATEQTCEKPQVWAEKLTQEFPTQRQA